jgi:hypothetical protein
MKSLLKFAGYLVGGGSAILLFLLDMYSLTLLAGSYGIGWAFAAFLIVPAQALVPFLVGTWIPALILIVTTFLGFALLAVAED